MNAWSQISITLLVCAASLLDAQALPLSAAQCEQSGSMQWQVSGGAYHPETGQLVYTEDYSASGPAGQYLHVNYRDKNDRVFFSKLLDYSDARTAPEYIQIDWRVARLDARFIQNDQLYAGSVALPVSQHSPVSTTADAGGSAEKEATLLGYACEQSADRNGVVDLASLLAPGTNTAEYTFSDIVVDAGFDEYVRLHWQALVQGEAKTFVFFSAGRAASVRMRIQRMAVSECRDRFNKPELLSGYAFNEISDPQCFMLRPSSLIYKAFVQPIYLYYGGEDRRLYVYYGMTNIKDQKQNNQSMIIAYRYF